MLPDLPPLDPRQLADHPGGLRRLERVATQPIAPLMAAIMDRFAAGRQVMTQAFGPALRQTSGDLLRAGPVAASPPELVEWLLIPTLPLPWLAGPLAQVAAAMPAGGLLMIASLGPGSLDGLREALPLSGDEISELFPDMHDLGDLMVRQGFSAPVLESEQLTMTYGQSGRALADLHLFWPWGLLPTRQQQRRGLRGRQTLEPLGRQLEALRAADGRIALTLELVLAHAWRKPPAARPAADAPRPIQLVRRNRFADG